MSKETLLQLVERLREAGTIVGHAHDCHHVRWKSDTCTCGTVEHDAAVDAAAAALVAEIERQPKRNDFYRPHPGDDVPSRTRLDDNYPDVRVCTECGRARRAYEDSCPKCGYGYGF